MFSFITILRVANFTGNGEERKLPMIHNKTKSTTNILPLTPTNDADLVMSLPGQQNSDSCYDPLNFININLWRTSQCCNLTSVLAVNKEKPPFTGPAALTGPLTDDNM